MTNARHLTEPFIRRLIAALVLLCLIAAPAHAESWSRARSDNFVVYSNGPPLELERWVRKAERFDLYLRDFFGMEPDRRRDPNPLTIYLLEDPDAVRRVLGKPGIAGFYSPSSEGTFAVAHRRPAYTASDISGERSLYHEYAHHFMYRHFAAPYPAWYREGFAEYVASLSFEDALESPSAPAVEHAARAMRRYSFPIETILTAEIGAIAPEQRVSFYAWSRRLVHLLYSDTERTARLEAYLETFRNGGDAQHALRFMGDLDQLQADLANHTAADLRYPANARPLVYAGKVEVETLDPTASQLVTLILRRKSARDARPTVQALRRLAARAPMNAPVLLELALAERELAGATGAPDTAAREAVDRALALDPASARANVLAAQIEMARLAQSPRDPAGWDAPRRRLAAAMRAAPGDPYPALVYYRSFLDERRRPPADALEAVARAFALQPESRSIRLSYGLSLALAGQADAAREVLKVLVSDPHAARAGTQAMTILDRLERRGAAPSAAPPAEAETEPGDLDSPED